MNEVNLHRKRRKSTIEFPKGFTKLSTAPAPAGSPGYRMTYHKEKLYIFSKSAPASSMIVYIYDLGTASWETKLYPANTHPNFPATRDCAIISSGDFIYLYGGIYSVGGVWTTQTNLVRFNPETEAAPTNVRNLGASAGHGAAEVDGLIYFTGGYTVTAQGVNSYNNRCISYNIKNNATTTYPAIPHIGDGISAAIKDSKLFIYGGKSNNSDSVWRLDPTAWAKAATASPIRAYPHFHRIGTDFFSFNGDPLPTSNISIRISGNRVSTIKPSPYVPNRTSMSCATDDYIFILSGYDLWVFNP